MLVWLQRVRDYLVKKKKRSRYYSQKIDAMASSDHLCGKKDCFCVSRYACTMYFHNYKGLFTSENYDGNASYVYQTSKDHNVINNKYTLFHNYKSSYLYL